MTKQMVEKVDSRDIISFDDKTIQLIKDTVAKGATDQELQLFLYQAKKSGLDPLARQIYFMKRKSKGEDKITIQTSIDGFRLIADRSTNYVGQDEPKFIDKENVNHPISCTVTVYKLDKTNSRNGYSATAYWNEYCPASGLDFMWQKMPHTMLSKVAESLALRKAFPQDLSGIYTDEEITEQIDPVIPNKPVDPTMEKLRKKIFALGNELGLDSETTKNNSKKIFKVDSFTDLSKAQLEELTQRMEKKIEEVKLEITVADEFIEGEKS